MSAPRHQATPPPKISAPPDRPAGQGHQTTTGGDEDDDSSSNRNGSSSRGEHGATLSRGATVLLLGLGRVMMRWFVGGRARSPSAWCGCGGGVGGGGGCLDRCGWGWPLSSCAGAAVAARGARWCARRVTSRALTKSRLLPCSRPAKMLSSAGVPPQPLVDAHPEWCCDSAATPGTCSSASRIFFFRTELLTEQSTNYAEPSISDYDERRGPLVEYWKSQNGRQSGDPAKLASRRGFGANSRSGSSRSAGRNIATGSHLAASSDRTRILRDGIGVGSPVDWCRPETNVVTQLRRPIHE